ncbi:LPXTG cell wall anchor domain-containing protein [Dolosicoccus paucivorans]|uniref:LPXTG cell wall anchor domain-containing protein n=1 Tax=Dolosicoccus paucivorans TaxID=84521 RepID=UPI001FD12A3D|nr:LPXTG cell wall anchor domain-containing protein [Dolosicoccus paucivorans]
MHGDEGVAFNKDGSQANGNYVPETHLDVYYEYEKVTQPGRFSEEHHYFIVYQDENGNPVDANGNPVEAGQNIVEQTDLLDKPDFIEAYPGTNFASTTKEKDGYVYNHEDTTTNGFVEDTVIDTNGNVTGDYAPSIHQSVVYNYYKTQVIPTTPVVEEGTFEEHHNYFDVEKDFDGNVVDRTKNEETSYTSDRSTGQAEDIFTTVKDERDGYEFTEVTDATEGTPFDENGEPTEGHYIPSENQSVTYEYEKVRQPGRFQDTHKYFIEKVDENGNVLEIVEVTEMEYTNAFQEGFRGETQFVAGKDEKDDFVFRYNSDSALERPEYNQDGIVRGEYVAGVMQEITYNYFKQEVVPTTPETPEPEVPEKPETPEPEVPETPETPEPEVPETPETPEPEVPEKPETPEPEVPEKPETPEPEVPETPETPEPEVPETSETPEPEVPEKPETPEPEVPEKPETPEPEVPEKPETPEPEVPEKPETPEPEVPEVPETPELEVPEKPETPEPEVPETPEPEVPEKPETPEPEVPEKPETPEPEVPEKPETPEPEVPETPEEPNEPEQPSTPSDGGSQGTESGDKSSVLPETGEMDNHTLFSTGILSVLTGLGLLGYRRKRED